MAPAATASATAPTPSTNHNNPTIVAARKPYSASHRRSDTCLSHRGRRCYICYIARVTTRSRVRWHRHVLHFNARASALFQYLSPVSLQRTHTSFFFYDPLRQSSRLAILNLLGVVCRGAISVLL